MRYIDKIYLHAFCVYSFLAEMFYSLELKYKEHVHKSILNTQE